MSELNLDPNNINSQKSFGTVSWFKFKEKMGYGYGFIKIATGEKKALIKLHPDNYRGKDIFVYYSAIQMAPLKKGDRVTFEVVEGKRGLQAINVAVLSELTPKQIFNGLKTNDIDKLTAINYLRSIVENSNNTRLRVESIEIIGKLEIKDDNNFEFLENLLVSDTNELVRSAAVKVFINHFLEKSENSLIWVFKHEKSENCLLTVYQTLCSIDSHQSRNLVLAMEENIAKIYIEKFGVAPEEAIALGILNRSHKLANYNPFEIKNGNVQSLYLDCKGDSFILETLKIFPHLKRLETHYYSRADCTGLKSLRSLKITKPEHGGIGRISNIKGLDTLTNLKKLDLSECDLIEIEGLEKLINLEVLNLSENTIEEIKGLENLINLKDLILECTSISEIKGLENLINLNTLNLSRGEWKDLRGQGKISEIKGLEALVNLKELDLEGHKITEIKGLENLVNLKSINLKDNPIKKEELKYVAESPQKIVEYCRQKKLREN